jgi:hypothetical protein
MKLITLALALLVSFSLLADPIKDNVISSKRVGWFSNQGKLTCRETCKANYGLMPEKELYDAQLSGGSIVNREITYLCKVQVGQIRPPISNPTHVPRPITMWTYGNELMRKRVCEFVMDHEKIDHSEKYFCLCVTR